MDSHEIRVDRLRLDNEGVNFWQAGFLFNQWRHLRQQRPGQMPWLVQAVNRQTGLSEARCAIWSASDEAAGGPVVSPAAAPFGSVEFAPTLPDAVLAEFVDVLLETVQKLNTNKFIIRHYPAIYAPDQTARLRSVLAEKGVQEVANYENSHLAVTDAPFADGLAPAARRRLRQAHQAGLRWVEWPQNRLDEAIAFIVQSRARQDYPLTLPPDRLRHLFSVSDAFRIMAVVDTTIVDTTVVDDSTSANTVIASLAVTVQVSPAVLYYFLPVDNLDYRHLSPAILLTEGLYNFCQQNAVRLLDLGVSLNDDRTEKPSLLRFKRGLGAQASAKLVFVWDG
jgi:hypothetical protein